MILNLDNKLFIDMDKVSLVDSEEGTIIADGVLVYGGTIEKYINTIGDAFKWMHKSHIYDKNLKITYGKGE